MHCTDNSMQLSLLML